MTLEINWLAVLAAAVVTFVLGGVWYGPLFGRVWRTAEGQAEPQPERQKHPAIVYGLSFVLMLIAVLFIVVIAVLRPGDGKLRKSKERH